MRIPKSSPDNNCGATLIEAVIVFPILLILIFAVIDLSRYWGVQGLISQGAQRGIDIAVKTQGLDFEMSTAHTLPEDLGYKAYINFIKARTDVIDRAERLPKATLVGSWDTGSNSSKFLGFPNYTVFKYGAIRTETVNAVLLRPGESVLDLEDVRHFHPTVCPPTTDATNAACLARMPGARSLDPATDAMSNLLQTDPLVIEMPILFRPILPIPLPALFRPKGIAGGFQEILANGAYPIPPADVLGTPTPSPTPTSGGTPDPTPTVTLTYTPTPTPVIPCMPACDSAAVMNDCANQNMACSECIQGSCVCSNDCSTGG